MPLTVERLGLTQNYPAHQGTFGALLLWRGMLDRIGGLKCQWMSAWEFDSHLLLL